MGQALTLTGSELCCPSFVRVASDFDTWRWTAVSFDSSRYLHYKSLLCNTLLCSTASGWQGVFIKCMNKGGALAA